MKKIDQKIVGYEVLTPEKQANLKAEQEKNSIVQMHESLQRPEMLIGSTYKIKPPMSEHAMYVTINDVVLNESTEHEVRRPFEIFINSKNMEHYQWVVALTLLISAVFRKGGDITFIVDELSAVFDPQGGYFKRGGKFMPSLVAEIGEVVERHLKMIGMIADDSLDEHQKKLIAEKRAEYEARQNGSSASNNAGDFPADAQLCKKCNTKAAIVMDGCLTCLNCGDSKCG
ncbi:MAG: NrdJb [Reinekea sp.]